MTVNKPAPSAADGADRLRQQHRTARAGLSTNTQSRHAQALRDRIDHLPEFRDARHIAGYAAIKGEIDVNPVLQLAHANGKSVYLPALRENSMLFLPWIPGSALVQRGMGLYEPPSEDSLALHPAQLDIVLTPLVVFDKTGHRIGQGGGYYDRTFAFKHHNPTAMPFLLGVAHESQREGSLTPMPWDVTLNAVATDAALHRSLDTGT